MYYILQHNLKALIVFLFYAFAIMLIATLTMTSYFFPLFYGLSRLESQINIVS